MDASLSIGGAAAPAGVTTFSNEACEGVDVLGNFVPSTIIDAQEDLQNLKDYFQRPRLIARGSFSFGSRAVVLTSQLQVSNLQNWFPQWQQRLSGVYGISFTTRFRLQVAATAFHQGVVSLGFQYQGSTATTVYDYLRFNDSQAASNLPHVRLDLSENTMVELAVPFLNTFDYMPVSGVDTNFVPGSIGVVGVNILLPLISVTGLVAPSYELYISLEDLKFFGADNYNSSTITLQSGFQLAEELRTSKLVSRSLAVGSEISSFVARNVPMLSAVAGPAAWVLDQGSRLAKYFGFSKPLLQEPPMRVIRQPYASDGHVDLPFAGFAVGPFQGNSLSISPEVGGTNVDEMSLAYVTSQWSQINVGTVTTSNTHSTTVYATPVAPCAFWFRAGASAPYCNLGYPTSTASVSGNCILPSNLMYISSFFRLWRGSIQFRVTFAKTKFHGGRYLIAYNPSTVYNTGATAFATIDGPEVLGGLVQPYGYSKMMDLRDGNVFEFSVPYVEEMPYVTFDSSIGGLSITCIDPLQANSSVTVTVPFMVEVRGGPDFELADYRGNKFVPYARPTFLLQSGDFTKIDDSGPSTLNPVVQTATKEPAHLTIGEKILSVKQLIQIPSYTSSQVTSGNTFTMTIPPWFYYNSLAQLGQPLTSPIPVGSTFTGSNYAPGALAQMYVFARGSSDLHAYYQGTHGQLTVDQLPSTGNSNSYGTSTTYAESTNMSATPKVFALNDAPLHVRFPAYQTVVRIPANFLSRTNFTRLLGSVPSIFTFYFGHFPRLKASNQDAVTANVLCGFCAGDDAVLVGFKGAPPIVIPNNASTNPVFTDYN